MSDVFLRTVCAVGGARGGLAAVGQVERLRPPGGNVVLVSVVETQLAAHAGMHATDVRAELEADARRALDAALEVAPAGSTRIIEGRPEAALLWALGEERATLVACQDGRSRAAGMILGSVVTAMLRDAPCSVLVARETEGGPRAIVVGVDGSPESLVAVSAAKALADRLGAPLHAITATGGKPIDAEGIHESGLEPTFDAAAPVDALVSASEDADLVVLGSRGLHGIPALGSVSERVAHQAGCSVLVVRSPATTARPSVLRTRDVMTTPVLTARPDTTVRELAGLMVDHGVGSIVITNEADGILGIVTETDFEVTDDPVPDTFLKWPRLLGRHVWSEESLEEVYAEARNRTAESVMSAPVETVDLDTELWQATERMLEKGIKHLVVVEEGRLAGIATRHDLLKALLATSP